MADQENTPDEISRVYVDARINPSDLCNASTIISIIDRSGVAFSAVSPSSVYA